MYFLSFLLTLAAAAPPSPPPNARFSADPEAERANPTTDVSVLAHPPPLPLPLPPPSAAASLPPFPARTGLCARRESMWRLRGLAVMLLPESSWLMSDSISCAQAAESAPVRVVPWALQAARTACVYVCVEVCVF